MRQIGTIITPMHIKTIVTTEKPSSLEASYVS